MIRRRLLFFQAYADGEADDVGRLPFILFDFRYASSLCWRAKSPVTGMPRLLKRTPLTLGLIRWQEPGHA